MIAVLDASTLINLCNGEVFAQVLAIPASNFLVSGAVREESRSIAAAVNTAVTSGTIALVDDSLISSRDFNSAKTLWGLGDGETECILAARQMNCAIGLDDWAARTVATRELGSSRVLGSLGFLRLTVSHRILQEKAAYGAYRLMRSRGGYLPDLSIREFSALETPRT